MKTAANLTLGIVIGICGLLTFQWILGQPKLPGNSLVFPVTMHRDLTAAIDSGYTQVRTVFLANPKTGGLFPAFAPPDVQAGIHVMSEGGFSGATNHALRNVWENPEDAAYDTLEPTPPIRS